MRIQYRNYIEEALELYKNNEYLQGNKTAVAKFLHKKYQLDIEVDKFRKGISDNLNKILNKGVIDSCNFLDVESQNVKHLWKKTKEESLFIKNPDYKEKEEVALKEMHESLILNLQNYSPNFVKLKREKSKDSYLLVVDPADIHIGKLASAFEVGEDYNNQIAVERVLEGVKGILEKASSFHIDKILFIGGNDVLHIDNPKRTTTSGTPQDTDGMWHTNFLIAKQLYVDILELLIGVADVHFIFNPSNHDYTNGYFLAQVIQTHFRKCKNITFDCSISHRKGFKYYTNLIGTTHGDGAKTQDLPLLMAQQFPVWWGETKHRYVYIHHIHHKMSKDIVGVTVESLRSPSGTDSWHHRNGYEFAPKAVEGFIHCKKHGQICRITHIF